MIGSATAKLQCRVLYRQFLFRVVDLEVLSADALGDSNKLLGQFAALPVLFSVIASFGAFGAGDLKMPPDVRIGIFLLTAHFLIATTMLLVGIFAVLSWDSTFPNRRDVLVLAPLPVRAGTIFLAKVAATATALGLVVLVLHCATGLTWPFAFAASAGGGFLATVRSFVAYWFTMLAVGAFIYCSLLAVQGFAAQILPRRLFLRASGILQMGAFCSLICVYFLEPPDDSLKMLSAPQNRNLLLSVPSYWFLGLFNQLNGSSHPALSPLAHRAWIGLAIATLAAASAYWLSYMRTIRQIVEEPDITSSPRGIKWLPRFGNSVQTAIGQFCVRTLSRSRQHRLMLAFYLGIGLAFTILLLPLLQPLPQSPGAAPPNLWHQANTPLLAASIMMMALAVVGMRVVFAFPLDLGANWIFRAVGVHDAGEVLRASRRALLALSVAPVWLVSAAVCFWLWPWRQAAAHLAVLGLLGIILADLILYGFRKIPFTCSYLPGKSQVHMMVIAAFILIMLVAQSVIIEREALHRPGMMAGVLAMLGVVAIAIRWRVRVSLSWDEEGLQFEEEAPALLDLGLYRDGAALGGPPSEPPPAP